MPKKNTKDKFFKGRRAEIGKCLIQELEKWDCDYKVKDEEFYRLVEKLFKIK